MSSSYIVEPQESESKKDDTLIIVVNDNGTISVDQETLQNLIMNQSNANVSVVRVGQTEADAPNGDLTFTVDPPVFSTTMDGNQNPATTTTTTPEIVDPFKELDSEQLERLETALQSEEAKQILGENVTAMLDMLSVEEQQLSIRHSIELDHCYTSRLSPCEQTPSDPLNSTDSPEEEKMDTTSNVSVPPTIPMITDNISESDSKSNSLAKGAMKKPVGRPRKTSTTMQSPSSISKVPGSPRNVSESPKSASKLQDEEDEEDISTTESSESDASDDDLDFGPRGPRRGGVRARGGRKGLTTRGGSMTARRPGRPSRMDIDQARRLNVEMAAAVDEMKVPGNNDTPEQTTPPGRSKKQFKTMGGKKKEPLPVSTPAAEPAVPVEQKLLQTTNQVKANLISANMIKGDMILTKPGQSRNNQKVYVVQKKVSMTGNEMTNVNIKKSPIVITKGPMKVPNQIQTKLGTSEDGKLITITTKQSVQVVPQPTTTVAQKIAPLPELVPLQQEVPQVSETLSQPPTTPSVKVKPVLEVKKEKHDNKVPKTVDKPVSEPQPQKLPEAKTPDSSKKAVKKEVKKSPAVLAESLGPALFSTPDIIRRVGSLSEAKNPEQLPDIGISDPSTHLEQAPSTPIKSDPSPLNQEVKAENVLQPEDEIDNNTNTQIHQDEPATDLLDNIDQDKKDDEISKDPITDDLNLPLDAVTHTPLNLDSTQPTESAIEQSGIEGNEHLLATLEMEASKHEEELLAEALLLQEQLDVDLNVDPTALDGPATESLLPTAEFETSLLPAPTVSQTKPTVSEPPVTTTNINTAPSTEIKKKDGKEPIQIVRGGRVITLPPIEAPATRSKRLQSKTDTSPPKALKTPKKEEKPIKQTIYNQPNKVDGIESEMDDEDEEENSDSEDDPNRLWCICEKPHNNRFMICCDSCEDWFHGKCVNISTAMGQQMEEQGIEWVCPNCLKKKSDEPSTPKSSNKSLSKNKTPEITPKSQLQTQKQTQMQTQSVVDTAAETTIAKSEPVTLPTQSGSGSMTQCVVCKKEARNSSIYCSDACILAHAQETQTKDKPVQQTPAKMSTGKDGQKPEARVIVFERKTGKILTGTDAPTRSNLQNWLKEHPTFEAVRSNNLSSIQIGNKTITSLQTSGASKVIKTSSASGQPVKMIYTKVAGSKQTILAPSNKKITIVSSSSSSPQSPQLNKTGQQKPIGISTTKNSPQVLKQTTIKTIAQQSPQQSKSPAINKQQIVKKCTEQKTSTPVQKTLQKSQAAKKSEPEPIRLNVRKTLAEVLTTRLKETDDLKLSDEEISDLALNIELEMYKYFRDAGAKYKAKYRSLVFNIKDTKNLTLFRKIAEKSLTPDAVVRLSPEEMASQELAEWREKETKHQLEMIKKNELDLMAQAKSIVVKTHKGEQIIENDGGLGAVDPKTPVQDIVTVLNNADNNTCSDILLDEREETTSSSIEDSKKFTKHDDNKMTTKSKKKDKDRSRDRDSRHKSREKETVQHKDSKARDGSTSRSRKHRSRDRSSHRDRRKSKDRKRDRERDRDKDRDKDKDHHRERSKEKEKGLKDKERERSHRSSKSSRSKSSHRDHKDKVEQRNDKKKNDSEDERNSKKGGEETRKDEGSNEKPPIEDRLWRHIEEETTSNTIDGNDSDVSDREPSSTVTIKTPDINEETEKESNKEQATSLPDQSEHQQEASSSNKPIIVPIKETGNKIQSQTVWRGFVNMPDVAKFFITAQGVSGQPKDLMDDLPDTIDVVGRISPETVWDYISKMKKSGSKEILVIRLTAANDEEKIPYITLYSYLNSRNRLGVIGTVSKNIKDFYIIPLPSYSQIPSVLLPLNGAEFEDNRPHLLLGIIVRSKRKRPLPSVSSTPQIPTKIIKKDSDRSYTPPPASSSSSDVTSVINSINKGHTNILRTNSIINQATISKIVPELSSKLHFTVESPDIKLASSNEDNNDDNDDNNDNDDDHSSAPTISSGSVATVAAINTTASLLPVPPDNGGDDDEPYSPGGMDDDTETDNLLPLSSSNNHTSEIQRKMEELNRRIEEQKQQIQNMSSSFLADVAVPTLPGLGLDPPGACDEDEAYSPTDSRSFTPPPQQSGSSLPKLTQPILDKVQDITIPPNLQEILANVKRQGSSKVDPYLPSKPGASFLTSINPERTYTPTTVTAPKETKSKLRSLSDMDLIKKAEEELAAVAAATAAAEAAAAAAAAAAASVTSATTATPECVRQPPPIDSSLMAPVANQPLPSAELADSNYSFTEEREVAYTPNKLVSFPPPIKTRISDQPKPPGLEDEELPIFPSTPPHVDGGRNNSKTMQKSGIVLSVKRKCQDDGGSSSPSKTPRTKSRWGQGPLD